MTGQVVAFVRRRRHDAAAKNEARQASPWSTFDLFTGPARRVLAAAHNEALCRNADAQAVATTDILIALLDSRHPDIEWLVRQVVSAEAVRDRLSEFSDKAAPYRRRSPRATDADRHPGSQGAHLRAESHHILLGLAHGENGAVAHEVVALLRDDDGAVVEAMRACGAASVLTLRHAMSACAKSRRHGPAAGTGDNESMWCTPFTPSAKATLDAALAEAVRRPAGMADIEDIVRALTRGDGGAAALLAELGVQQPPPAIAGGGSACTVTRMPRRH